MKPLKKIIFILLFLLLSLSLLNNSPTLKEALAANSTIDFNNITPVDRALNGQYPAGVVNWGNNIWYVGGPWGLFNTNSISFNGSFYLSYL